MKNYYFNEIDCNPTKEQQDFLDYLMGDDFPLFYSMTTSGKHMMYGHTLMYRNKNDWLGEGHINSGCYDYAKNFFLEICDKNNIQVDTILRAAVNHTIYHPDGYCDIHVDHPFPHFNFVYHINDTDAPTKIYDDQHNFLAQSSPKKNRVTIFSGMPHCQAFPKPTDRRIVLLFTFLGGVNKMSIKEVA